MKFATIALSLALAGAAHAQEAVPFHYIGGHFICVDVKVNDSHPSQFILDTGIGLNILSTKLAKQLGVPETGMKHRGQRMSGQFVEVPLSWVPTLSLGSFRQQFVPVGTFGFENGFMPDSPEYAKVEGFLSLRFFDHQPFTVDYGKHQIILETPASLEARAREGTSVPITLEDDLGTSLTAFTNLEIAGVGKAKVEVDTGSYISELHVKYMRALGINPDDKGVKTVHGTDETQHAYTRYFTKSEATLKLTPQVTQSNAPLMFQETIHEGIIGDEFLHKYTVTYDLAHSRMIFK